MIPAQLKGGQLDEPWLQGFNLRGREYNASETCVPLHQAEFDTNPNL